MAKILIVDDDELIVFKTTRHLKNAGHDVLQAANGKLALELVASQKPDLVITDVLMPEMGGWALIRELRSHPESAFLPVIFLTVLNSTDDRIRGFHLGADDYLPKPFLSEELLLRVEKTLRTAAANREQAARSLNRGGSDFQGSMEHFGVSSLLILLEMERKSGELALTRPGESICLLLNKGRIIRAHFDAQSGERSAVQDGPECIYHVLTWTSGRFAFMPRDVAETDVIRMSTTALLMEAARRLDEKKAD